MVSADRADSKTVRGCLLLTEARIGYLQMQIPGRKEWCSSYECLLLRGDSEWTKWVIGLGHMEYLENRFD